MATWEGGTGIIPVIIGLPVIAATLRIAVITATGAEIITIVITAIIVIMVGSITVTKGVATIIRVESMEDLPGGGTIDLIGTEDLTAPALTFIGIVERPGGAVGFGNCIPGGNVYNGRFGASEARRRPRGWSFLRGAGVACDLSWCFEIRESVGKRRDGMRRGEKRGPDFLP